MKGGRYLTVLSALILTLEAVAVDMEVPLFMSASDTQRQGFVRVINHSQRPGTVTVRAVDDSGRSYEAGVLDFDAHQTIHFNSDHLELGDTARGITGIGGGQGDWRLVFSSDLDIEVLAYARTTDGFLTAMHDAVPPSSDNAHRLPIFNPGRNTEQESRLRLINGGDERAEIVITGVDDHGDLSEEAVVTLAAGYGVTYTASQLEAGAPGIDGAMGTGRGKWQLFVQSDVPIQVVSLMATPTGHLTNLSTTTRPSSISDIPGRGPDLIDEFSLDPENSLATGIAFFNERFYVLDYGGTLFAYTLLGERDEDADIELTYRPIPAAGEQPLRDVVGLAYWDGRLYTFQSDRVRALTPAGRIIEAASFDVEAGHSISDITVAPQRFYMAGVRSAFASEGAEVLVYDRDGEFLDGETFLSDADSDPDAIAYDPRSEYLYVVDSEHEGFISVYTVEGDRRLTKTIQIPESARVAAATIAGDAIYLIEDRQGKVLGFPLHR